MTVSTVDSIVLPSDESLYFEGITSEQKATYQQKYTGCPLGKMDEVRKGPCNWSVQFLGFVRLWDLAGDTESLCDLTDRTLNRLLLSVYLGTQ